jgi:hypothetical protein
MAQKFLTHIDLNQNQIKNATFEVLGTAPNTGNFEGRMYYNSTTDSIQIYSGSAWRKVVNSLASAGTNASALTFSESNGEVSLTLNLADTANAGLLSAAQWQMLTDATDNATALKLIKRDGNGNAKVATPTDDAHIATKGYVDAARSGLDVKQSVRVATTGALTLSTGFINGSVVDGVTLATGDRVLIKDQNTGAENGVYVVNVTGAPTRATDYDSNAEVTPGAFTFVEEGTVNDNSGWVLSNNGAVVIGSTNLTFSQFSGTGQITAGDGLSKNGNILNVNVTSNRTAITADAIDISANYVGQTSITTLGTITTGVWNGTDVAVADGGTGASTAADARTNLAATSAGTSSTPVLSRTTSQTIGNGAALVYTITHNFNTRDIVVQIYDTASYDTVVADVVRTTADLVTITFTAVPALNSYRVVITG